MKLGNAIHHIHGLRYLCELLPLQSAPGRRRMLAQAFLTEPEALEFAFHQQDEMLVRLENKEYSLIFKELGQALHQIHEIQGTLSNLKGGNTLDDIELFELKRFALLAHKMNELLQQIDYHTVNIPSLEEVIELLDPEGNRMAHFFIYSAYHPELKMLRQRQKEASNLQNGEGHQLVLHCMAIEDQIRQQLSEQLKEYLEAISTAYHSAAHLDFLLARATLALQLGLVRPEISKEKTVFQGLFNPEVKALLEASGRVYQPVSLELTSEPCLLTGANMAGKTVLLKTIALNQYLFQYGFYVAAGKAQLVPVEEIMLGIGDDQSELSGMSSFAAEMINIQRFIERAKVSNNILLLIDEPARTTNPQEGIALVNALIHRLDSLKVRSLITTHYSGLQTHCRKLRVKGLNLPQGMEILTVANLNSYMDYTLIEDQSDEVPMEALKIAQMLGVEPLLIETAQQFLLKNQNKL